MGEVDRAGATLTRPRRVLVVANPSAGLRARRSAGDAVAGVFSRAGAEVHLERTRAPGDATRLAARAAGGGIDLVVAVGGDGTAHEAANGLIGSGTALGVAPTGTMNLLARVLRLPVDAVAAAESTADRFRPRAIRPGRAGGRCFLLMAGAGFDAWVLRALRREGSGKIRFRDYVRGALAGFVTFPFAANDIRHDGARIEAHSLVVGRAPLYGGFLRPTPHVRLEDGFLEMCALSGGRRALAVALPRMLSGAHGACPGVTLARVRRVDADASGGREVPYQLDGELAGILPVTFALSESRLILAAPRPR